MSRHSPIGHMVTSRVELERAADRACPPSDYLHRLPKLLGFIRLQGLVASQAAGFIATILSQPSAPKPLLSRSYMLLNVDQFHFWTPE